MSGLCLWVLQYFEVSVYVFASFHVHIWILLVLSNPDTQSGFRKLSHLSELFQKLIFTKYKLYTKSEIQNVLKNVDKEKLHLHWDINIQTYSVTLNYSLSKIPFIPHDTERYSLNISVQNKKIDLFWTFSDFNKKTGVHRGVWILPEPTVFAFM